MIRRTGFIIPALLVSVLVSCKHEIPASTDTVCFESQVLPIIQTNCAKAGCHDAETHESGYQLDAYAKIVSRGLNAGNASGSTLYRVLTDNGSDRMPPDPNSQLSTSQISLIAQWINEGAKNSTNCAASCDSSKFTYSGDVVPILQTHCYGCHSGTADYGGGIPLDFYDAVYDQVQGGGFFPSIDQTGPSPMPQNSAKLSDCKIAVIRKWIEAGAPNN